MPRNPNFFAHSQPKQIRRKMESKQIMFGFLLLVLFSTPGFCSSYKELQTAYCVTLERDIWTQFKLENLCTRLAKKFGDAVSSVIFFNFRFKKCHKFSILVIELKPCFYLKFVSMFEFIRKYFNGKWITWSNSFNNKIGGKYIWKNYY